MRAMSKHTAHDQIAGVVAIDPRPYTGAAGWPVFAPARHLMRVGKVSASERETGPTITAVLQRGPLAGRRIDVDVVEGRPPKTIDARADDGSTCRYCLADWAQTGPSAIYTFLYLV
jgi:hypothetical protein